MNNEYKVSGGADNGNGTFKGVFSVMVDGNPDGTSYYEKPNVQVATTKELDTSDWNIEKIFGLGSNLIIEEEETKTRLGVESKSKIKYFIGDLALEKNENLQELDIKDTQGKLNNNLSVRGTSAYIAAEVVKYVANKIKNENGKFEVSDLDKIDDIKIEVTLATALPVSAYTKPVADQLANKFREKEHVFNILLPKRRRCKITINYVKVAVDAEAKATTRFFCTAKDNLFKEFNEKAKKYNGTETGKLAPRPILNKEFFKDKENLIFHTDIGEGTAEFVFTYGNEWKEGISTGIESGIGRASIEIADALKDVDGTKHLRSQKMISKVLKEKKDRFFDVVASKAIPELEKQSEEIETEFKRIIQSNSPSLAIIYGGGSILLREFLEENIEKACEKSRIPLLYVPKELSVKLNALGLYSYAISEEFEETILE